MHTYLIDFSFSHQAPSLNTQRLVQLSEELDTEAVQANDPQAVKAIMDHLKIHADEFSTSKLMEKEGQCWVHLNRGADSLLKVNFIADVDEVHLDSLTRIAAIQVH